MSKNINAQNKNADIREQKDFWFACVDIDVIRDKSLTPSAKFIFTVLCSFVNINNRNCWPSNDAVAKAAGVSKTTVIRAYRELEARGVIKRTARRSNDGQTSSYTQILGHRAACYDGEDTPDLTQGSSTDDIPPMSPVTSKRKQKNDIYYSTREADAPKSKNSITDSDSETDPVTEKDENKKSALTSKKNKKDKNVIDRIEPFVRDSLCDVNNVPESMRPTARYLLLRTGKQGLTLDEVAAVCELSKIHTPARIQKEIDKCYERFIRLGRDLRLLSFNYIADVLKYQTPTFGVNRKISKAEQEKIKAETHEFEIARVIAITEQVTDEEMAALIAEINKGK